MILFIYPEGSFCWNPHFRALVNLLAQRGIRSAVIYPKREDMGQQDIDTEIIRYPIECENLMVDMYHSILWDQLLDNLSNDSYPQWDTVFQHVELIVGVDRGIIDGSFLAAHYNQPLVLLSYEQFFENETSLEFKQLERNACAPIELALVQDCVRAQLLARENDIDPAKIRLTPVAGLTTNAGTKSTSRFEKGKLGIPSNARIALYMGSLQLPQAMLDEIIDGLDQWPEDWVFLINCAIHDASKLPIFDKLRHHSKAGKLYFSEGPLDWRELPDLLEMVDLGFAFYHSVEGDPHRGKNVKHIGLSAGKISTYLQYGVPYVCNDIGEFAELANREQIGWTVRTLDELPSLLCRIDTQGLTTRARKSSRFFCTNLDPEQTIPPILDEWQALMKQPPAQKTSSISPEHYLHSLERSFFGSERAREQANNQTREWFIRGTGEKGIQTLRRLHSLGYNPDGFTVPKVTHPVLCGKPVLSTEDCLKLSPKPFISIASHLSPEIVEELKSLGLNQHVDWHVVV